MNYKYTDKCYNAIAERADIKTAVKQQKREAPHMIYLANCVASKFKDPFTGKEYTKETLGLFVVLFDVASVIALVVFTSVLIDTQEEYAETFDAATIEMADFTMRVRNLPHHKFYENNDEALRAALIAHFEQVVKDEIAYIKENELFARADEFDDIADIGTRGDALRAYDWEVADVCFGSAENKSMELLTEMGNIQLEHTR